MKKINTAKLVTKNTPFLFIILIIFSCNNGKKSLTTSSNKNLKNKPNVLVIISDDQGWGDIGYNNPQHVYTPNLDKLAANGAVFTRNYSMPQCTPTRVALLTGKYPGRFGHNALQATNSKVFPIGIPTLASMFKAEGYRTYLDGKWHMGSDTVYGPNHFGFDESYGSLAGAVGMYDHRYREGKYEDAWHRNLKPIPGNENGIHATDLVAKEAERVIKIDDKKPFFLYLAFHAPHTPLDERGTFVNRPTQLNPQDSTRWLDENKIKWFNDPKGKIQSEPDPEKRLFLAAVYHLDDAIGRVVNALEETGQRKNTIILFTSDNGPQVNWSGNAYPDDLHVTEFNQPIPMRGSKLDVYEGGIHVPGFINWPGKIHPKKVKEPVHVIDWFPTLSKLIQHKESENYALDGIDLSPVLFGDEKLPERSFYWVWNNHPNRWALRFEQWKIIKYGSKEPEHPEDWNLYNLKQDSMEKIDVSRQHPDKVKELHEMYLKHREKDLF